MDMDLSAVKKENLELDDYDYGQTGGNILDNFISDTDYDEMTVPNLTCDESDDVNVEWLSIFDKPIHDSMSGLNPPLTDAYSTLLTSSISNITSFNGNTDNLGLGSYSPLTESFINGTPYNESSKCSIQTKNNPFLSHLKSEDKTVSICNEAEKPETKVSSNTEESINEAKKCEEQKELPKTGQKPKQKIFLFMNTPENRAKLIGKNFNIINTSLLARLGNEKRLNIISLKRHVNVKNANKDCAGDKSDEASSKIKKGVKENSISSALQKNVMEGLKSPEKETNTEIDSGYESPTSSSGSSPRSPPTVFEKSSPPDALQYIDVPPQERHPFYLSYEERKTLIIEGLPVPTGLPLTKAEERALKKVRRKIKNKISAQESRRKKKEYMEALEKKVDTYIDDNKKLKKKIANLEMANKSLVKQVQKLQGIVTLTVANDITPSKQVQPGDKEVIEQSVDLI